MNKFNTLWIFALICLLPLPVISNEKPDAFELMNNFAATQEKLRSFTAKSECSTKVYTFSDNKPEYQTHSTCDVRVDGKRACVRNYAWGDINSRIRLTKDKAYYVSHLWNGKDFYAYNKAKIINEFSKGNVFLIQNAEDKQRPRCTSTFKRFPGSKAMGYLPREVERVDLIIRKADSIRVRDKMEKIGGSDCYVIEAKARTGDYTVWIDPAHGYNIAKAEVRRGPGDVLTTGYVLPENDTSFSFLKNVRFKKMGDLWVPMEADIISGRHKLNSRFNNTMNSHYKIAEFVLNPDHDKLGSFVPDDILNGATVRLFKGNSPDRIPIGYTWQDGELIPNIDEAVIDEIDKMADEIMAEAKLETKPKFVPSAITVSDLLDKYRANQKRLQSFIAKAESKIEYTRTSGPSSRVEKELCEFRFDGNRVNHRSTFWDGLFTKKERPGYKSFLWDGKSFIVYRRAAELKNSRVFVKKLDLSKKRMIATEYKGAPLMGICGGDYDRIDSVLRKADNISLQQKTEQVGGSQCYVIDAVTKRGKYKVWIDPEHGYNIAKIEVQKKKGDLIRHSGSVRTDMSFSLRNVRFAKIDGVWVPMEADMQQNKNNRTRTIKWHHKRTEMILNPDHDALGSFVADDISDGTKVKVLGDPRIYVWQNGKPVTEAKSNVEP